MITAKVKGQGLQRFYFETFLVLFWPGLMCLHYSGSTGLVGGVTFTTGNWRGRVKEEEKRDVGTEDRWICVPPPGQKRGLDWRFAAERPSNSAPQTPDCLFLAPVGAVKQDQGQFTSNSTTSGSKLQLPIFTSSNLKIQKQICEGDFLKIF